LLLLPQWQTRKMLSERQNESREDENGKKIVALVVEDMTIDVVDTAVTTAIVTSFPEVHGLPHHQGTWHQNMLRTC